MKVLTIGISHKGSNPDIYESQTFIIPDDPCWVHIYDKLKPIFDTETYVGEDMFVFNDDHFDCIRKKIITGKSTIIWDINYETYGGNEDSPYPVNFTITLDCKPVMIQSNS